MGKLNTVDEMLKSENERFREAYAERQQIIDDAVAAGVLTVEQGEEKKTALEVTKMQQRLKNTGQFFADLQSMSGGNSEKLFKLQKGMAIASATIEGFKAVQGALAAPPFWPYNAASVIATGAMQVANIGAIASTQFTGNYAEGGIIPGNSYSGDKLTAGVNSSEMILNRQQQNRLFKMANGSASGKNQQMSVVIHNNASTRVNVRQSETREGQRLDVFVEEISQQMGNQIRTGGNPLADAMQSTYGLRRGAS